MYGPYFLAVYAVFILGVVIVLAIAKRLIDRTDRLPSPAIPHKIDPYEIAFLRGGINELARSVVFSLVQNKFLEVSNSGKDSFISRSKDQVAGNLRNIEKITLDWFGETRNAKDIFGKSGLVVQLKSFADVYATSLEQRQLLTSDESAAGFSMFKWIGILSIAAAGGYKMIAALMNGRFNITFLVILGVIGVIAARYVSKLPRMTKLGNAYLERLQLAFGELKVRATRESAAVGQQMPSAQTTFAGVDPLLLSVGVFGGSILAGTMYDSYNKAFERSQAVSASSCGASCGSCSDAGSCSGGSSCSSGCGSGCGGGCGGCGS